VVCVPGCEKHVLHAGAPRRVVALNWPSSGQMAAVSIGSLPG
jgi:hypothetical protein